MQKFFVFDIETAPMNWELLSESQQEYWLRNANSEEEIENRMFMRSLTPLTAQILCIGCMIVEKTDEGGWNVLKKGVLAKNPDENQTEIIEEIIDNDVKMQLSTEKKVLEDFWKLLNYYRMPTLISFNGRNFDIPFVMLRSASHKIRPNFNLMAGTKFNYPNHIDLIDELTFFSPTQWGATKKFNFDFYAHSFGIVSPKAQGIDGSKVPTFFAEGKIREISEYCMRDVVATWELFLFWNEYLNFKQF
jgi:DNA polymerase elongation subunit (family B)